MLTISCRFESALPSTLDELVTDLVPFDFANSVVSAYSPISRERLKTSLSKVICIVLLSLPRLLQNLYTTIPAYLLPAIYILSLFIIKFAITLTATWQRGYIFVVMWLLRLSMMVLKFLKTAGCDGCMWYVCNAALLYLGSGVLSTSRAINWSHYSRCGMRCGIRYPAQKVPQHWTLAEHARSAFMLSNTQGIYYQQISY